MKKAVRVFIQGSVQGIFFRDFLKQNADKIGIKGFARNLEDGRLEVWIEGDNKKVEQMLEACRTGPKHSQIKRIDILDEKLQDFREFKILKF